MNAVERAKVRDTIIAEVLRKHSVKPEAFYGPARPFFLVDARIDAARRLKQAGFTTAQIARILKKCDRSVRNYFNHTGERSTHTPLVNLALTAEVSAVVNRIAELEGVKVTTLLCQWIAERATFEAEAKARAA